MFRKTVSGSSPIAYIYTCEGGQMSNKGGKVRKCVRLCCVNEVKGVILWK